MCVCMCECVCESERAAQGRESEREPGSGLITYLVAFAELGGGERRGVAQECERAIIFGIARRRSISALSLSLSLSLSLCEFALLGN